MLGLEGGDDGGAWALRMKWSWKGTRCPVLSIERFRPSLRDLVPLLEIPGYLLPSSTYST